MNEILLQIGMAVFCLTTVGLHISKKNDNEAVLYSIQSLAVVTLLAAALLETHSLALLMIAVVTLAIKVVFAPAFFMQLIKRHDLKFQASTYLSVPGTLFALTLIFLLANSPLFAPLVNLAHEGRMYLVMSLWFVLSAVFLIVNRKGALSQATGVLALENSIVAFGIFTGLEQSAALQMGILFDVFVWLVVAVVMISMVYKHTGSLDVTTMRELKD